MRRPSAIDIVPVGLEQEIGGDGYTRGLGYAHAGAVVQAVWKADAGVLVGAVDGSRGRRYTTVARFTPARGAAWRFRQGECSCPVGFNCKHVAALVIAATAQPEAAHHRPASWERSLGAVLEPPAANRSGTPVAIELTVARVAGGGAKVAARLVRAGRGGWVAGNMSWSTLAGLSHLGEYDSSQIRLLQELYALADSRSATRYHYGDQKLLDLGGFDSSQLWPLLQQARAAGVQLVHGRSQLGEVPVAERAEVRMDVVTGASGELVVRPELQIDGAEFDPVPVCFVGADGHGVVVTDRAEAEATADPGEWQLRLAPLARPASRALQRLVLGDAPLIVPVAEQHRFRGEFYPRLRHVATVASSDASFTPPVISGPRLGLHAGYSPGHAVELTWSWRYEVDTSQVQIPLGPGATDGVRDPAAERALLDGLDVPLREYGLTSAGGTPLPRVRLSGLDTMLFGTELLPLLRDRPAVLVEVTGEQTEYREAGDTLQVSLSTTATGDTDWFDLGVTITVEGREVPFADVFAALAAGESHLLLADGAFFSLQKPQLQSLQRLIEEARALHDQEGPLRISRFQAGLWEELRQLGVVEKQAQEWQWQVDGLLSVSALEPPEVPATVRARLRPYQADGFGWLTFLWQHRLGGILADDMGLGKTLQTLALISHAKQQDPGLAPFLIVAPASVVANWAAEAQRFTPELTVVAVPETLARRGESLDVAARGADVLVTSYTLLRLDFEAYSAAPWSGLVLDEAQFAKNHQSKVYQCARRLPTPFKLAITGTPMENNLMELWSLLSITAPGLFPSPVKFKDFYAKPIEKGRDAELLAQLRRRIKPLVKRRTKEQVATDLPAKQEQVLHVELHPRHRSIYQRHLQRERQKVLGLLHDVQRNRFTILRSLTLLRQLALHAALVDGKHHGVPCSKIDALLEQLEEVTAGGHRGLVFSQFTGFLELVRARLDAAGIEYCYLDGRTRKRAEVIERFKNGTAPVFLISLKAGGFGLNLTEADYCFLLDPWWNPATEAQAVDRTHRIGQTRNVLVYRLIAADTIEEKVMALKARKAELFAGVMDDGNVFGATLSADDIRGLFT